MFGAEPLLYRSQPFAKVFIGLGTVKQRLSQRSQVKSRSPDQDRHTAAQLDLNDLFSRIASPIDRCVNNTRIDVIDQMMRHAALFVLGRFGGCDAYALIDLDGIAINDLAADMQCKFDTERRFARSRWPCDRKYWSFIGFFNHGLRQINTDVLSSAFSWLGGTSL